MKVLMCPVGSRGDVQPLVALGLGLRAAGHDVEFCAPPNFERWLIQLGFAYTRVGMDIQHAFDTAAAQLSNPVAITRAGLRLMRDEIAAQTEDLERAARGADLLIGIGLQMAARTVGESLGIPCFQVLYVPQPVPSADHPPLNVPLQNLPGWLNRASHWGLNSVLDLALLGGINEQRRKRNLQGLAHAIHSFLSPRMLLAFDAVLGSAPRSDQWEITQIPALIYCDPSPLSPELEAFLARGQAPIYVGFGSMTDANPAQTLALLQSCARRLKRRFIFAPGAIGRDLASCEDCLVIGDAPHHRLFPRVAAVVHHGGAGTTAAAMRAAAPQLIVPHLSDQFFNAARVHRRGLSPRPFSRAQLDENRLIASLQQILDGQTIRACAREVASSLSAHEGVTAAVAFAEAFGRRERPSPRAVLPSSVVRAS